MAMVEMVNKRTGFSHLEWPQGDADAWLRSDREGVALTHADDRYLEIRAYDYDAPAWRQWAVTVTDRETGASVTLFGERQIDTTSAALKQIGADRCQRPAAAA